MKFEEWNIFQYKNESAINEKGALLRFIIELEIKQKQNNIQKYLFSKYGDELCPKFAKPNKKK